MPVCHFDIDTTLCDFFIFFFSFPLSTILFLYLFFSPSLPFPILLWWPWNVEFGNVIHQLHLAALSSGRVIILILWDCLVISWVKAPSWPLQIMFLSFGFLINQEVVRKAFLFYFSLRFILYHLFLKNPLELGGEGVWCTHWHILAYVFVLPCLKTLLCD